MRIAVFDHVTLTTNAIGKCHLHLLRGLCEEHEFTVFSIRLDNPRPDRIRWVRVPVPVRPGALTFLAFYLVAPLCYWWHRLRHAVRFDIVQFVSGDLSFGDVSAAHFCSRAHLRNHWGQSRPRGLRRFARWLSYALRALAEPLAYRRARLITVCSKGLGREIAEEYPFARRKIRLCHNGVDANSFTRPENFDRARFRANLGLRGGDIALTFTALGAFELKGLSLLLSALSDMERSRLRLIVVGGQPGTVAHYQSRTRELGLGDRVFFVGTHRDVRPYLWASDGFALPSQHEAFPMAVLEAAAASLPIIVTRLNGVEEFLLDGRNGILVNDWSSSGVRLALLRFLNLLPEERRSMGVSARQAVTQFSVERFVATWRSLYQEFETHLRVLRAVESGENVRDGAASARNANKGLVQANDARRLQ